MKSRCAYHLSKVANDNWHFFTIGYFTSLKKTIAKIKSYGKIIKSGKTDMAKDYGIKDIPGGEIIYEYYTNKQKFTVIKHRLN